MQPDKSSFYTLGHFRGIGSLSSLFFSHKELCRLQEGSAQEAVDFLYNSVLALLESMQNIRCSEGSPFVTTLRGLLVKSQALQNVSDLWCRAFQVSSPHSLLTYACQIANPDLRRDVVFILCHDLGCNVQDSVTLKKHLFFMKRHCPIDAAIQNRDYFLVSYLLQKGAILSSFSLFLAKYELNTLQGSRDLDGQAQAAAMRSIVTLLEQSGDRASINAGHSRRALR